MWRRWWWLGCLAWLLAGPVQATTCGVTSKAAGNAGSGWTNYLAGSDCTTTTGGTVTVLHVWLDTGINNTHIKCSIYDRVGAQITKHAAGCDTASTTTSGTAGAKYDMAVTGACTVNASTSYWIGCIPDDNGTKWAADTGTNLLRYGNVGSYTLTGCASCATGLQGGPLSAYFDYTDNTPTITATSTRTATVTNTSTATATTTPLPQMPPHVFLSTATSTATETPVGATYTPTSTGTVTNTTTATPTETPTPTPPEPRPPVVFYSTPTIPGRRPVVFYSTPTFPPERKPVIFYSTVTVTETYTPTATPPSTQTWTATPTLTPDCRYDTFTIAAPADDGMLSQIDAAGAWPPAGGSGPADVTVAHDEIRIMIEGASNTAGLYAQALGGIPWPVVLRTGADAGWSVYNLGVNNQTTADYRMIGASAGWVETENHRQCAPAIDGYFHAKCTSDGACSPSTCTDGGGATGLVSDLDAIDPDVVILEPASNDALWPAPYNPGYNREGASPELTNVYPDEIVNRLVYQCAAVTAHNAATPCLVTTIGKGPYVAVDPWTSNFIDTVNAGIRATFSADRVIDFDTNSSNVDDYLFVPGTYIDYAHRWQRLLNQNASRVLAALTQTTANLTGPVLSAEAAQWNGTTTRSIAVMRWDTSSIPANYEPMSAQVTVHLAYLGASAAAATRSVGWRWANTEAVSNSGWTTADYPATFTANAYIGAAPTITTTERRGAIWTFNLDRPHMVSHSVTGLMAAILPDSTPDTDQYFTADMVSADDPLLTDQGPVLSVFSCKIPVTPVAVVPNGAVADVEGIGDIKACAATPAPAATPGPPYICVVPPAASRGIAPVPFTSLAVIPDMGTGLVRCQPGDADVTFLCRTTPTPGTTRVHVGQSGKAVTLDRWGDVGMCTSTSPNYLCASQ